MKKTTDHVFFYCTKVRVFLGRFEDLNIVLSFDNKNDLLGILDTSDRLSTLINYNVLECKFFLSL